MLEVPASELEDWHAKRTRAAMKVQAHWRGLVQRRKLAERSPERRLKEQESQEAAQLLKEAVAMRKSFLERSNTMVATPAGSPLRGFSTNSVAVRPSQSLDRSFSSMRMGTVPEGPSMLSGLGKHVGTGAASSTIMSSKRYQDLLKQIDSKTAAYKAQAKHMRADPNLVNSRLKELLRSYHSSAEDHIHAAHERQQALVTSEAVVMQLDALVPLAQLPEGTQPSDFPRPARGSERRARADQAHALMLAEVRAGTRWWNHLRSLNQEAVQLSMLEENDDRWQAMDQQWRRQWRAIEAEEAAMIDIVPNLKKRQGPPLPLSDIAITDAEDKLRRQHQREEDQEAAMRAAMLAAPPYKTSAPASSLQRTGHGHDAAAVHAGGTEDGEPELPLPPALRPGSMPIIIPSAMQSSGVQTSLRGSMAGVVDPWKVEDMTAAAAVGGAVLNILKDQRDNKAGPVGSHLAVTKQGEQQRPKPQPGTADRVGAAVLDMFYEQEQQQQLGVNIDNRRSPPRGRSPEGVDEAVGSAVLDGLQRQAILLQQRQAQRSDIPTAVGAAVLDMMAQPYEASSGGEDGRPLGRAPPSSVETQGAVGVAVLDGLQQQLNERRQMEAVAAGSERRAEAVRLQHALPGKPRAPPRVEMAVGAAYMESLGQPQQPPMMAIDIGAAVLSTLKDQQGSRS
ncbi:hypothetical protein CEUSTIGMA_g2567.t1 [Chlamydomonas eustigma]|uniref:Uncharacterized protein n=1 Tax=Chlamydomonas eustigma TaxID=1157962 RepID=A0A250WW97_9CHLO|nr:hypothetical protein CEUSTIGMA_g2567.t1 [Chlamydomonas eustigma]|eukprot:GAX75123.1 hypothetical protein CEUSTIGMA_g2567.t1 [Chlamydomonas eustigma]